MSALSEHERALARQATLELAHQTSALVLATLRQPPQDGSLSQRFAVDPRNLPISDSATVSAGAANTILLTAMAAEDHVDAFIASVKRGKQSVSNATVVRGVLEAYAKTYFLASAITFEQLLQRYCSLVWDELQYPVRHSSFADTTGALIDGAAYREAFRLLLESHGMGKPLAVPMTALVASLLEDAIDGAADPAIYSQLSGVAHAGTSSVGMFFENVADLEMVMPAQIGHEYTGYVFAAIRTAALAFIDAYAPPTAAHDRWLAALGRAESAIAQMRRVP